MTEHNEDIDALIAAALSGEASPPELERLALWRRSSPEHEARYQASARTFETLAAPQFAPDVDQAWKKLDARISAGTTSVIPLFGTARILRAAAAVALMITAAYLFYFIRSSGAEALELAATTKVLEQKLPDGSKVVANRNTSLRYTATTRGERKVELRGEAFFEVAHDEARPFLVTAGELEIRDIGTAFNVRSIPGADTTFVFVESGEVQLSTADNEGVRLGKGESGGFSRKNQTFFKTTAMSPASSISYRTRVFTFREESLSGILEQLNAAYGSNVQLENEALGRCRLSVSFNNEPLEVIVEVIAETLDLRKIKRGDTLMLSGDGCGQ
jgi:transmembrane sensor